MQSVVCPDFRRHELGGVWVAAFSCLFQSPLGGGNSSFPGPTPACLSSGVGSRVRKGCWVTDHGWKQRTGNHSWSAFPAQLLCIMQQLFILSGAY